MNSQEAQQPKITSDSLNDDSINKLYQERDELVSDINGWHKRLAFDEYDGTHFDGWDQVPDYDNRAYERAIESFSEQFKEPLDRIEEIDRILRLHNKFDRKRAELCFIIDF